MIRQLQVKDPESAPCMWWPKVEAFKDVKKFTFQPRGLIILWGPNGSGKSTILKTMARLTHCEQGGTPKVTQSSVWEIKPMSGEWRDGIKLIHDGQPVHFMDPAADPGLMGGAFDDDFFRSGMESMQLKSVSAGQRIMTKFGQITESAVTLKEVEWGMQRGRVNDHWDKLLAKVEKMLAPSKGVEKGARTLLLDEPDRSISIPKQIEFWSLMRRQTRLQMIIATHSVFALNIPEAQYIDVQTGYLDECRKAVVDFQGGVVAPVPEKKPESRPRTKTEGDKKVLRFGCAHCKAKRGQYCRSPSGQKVSFHANRHRKAFPDAPLSTSRHHD